MIMMIGVNYRTAPLSVREMVALPKEQVFTALQNLKGCIDMVGAVLLSTCNRTELYFESHRKDEIIAWLLPQWNISLAELGHYFYIYQAKEVVQHAILVASGLDSMVLGEKEIVGQLKKAIALSKEVGVFSKYLNQFFQKVFAAAKRVRTETTLGLHSLSIATIVSQLVSQLFVLPTVKVLLIGAGETICLIAEHFRVLGIENITIANRTLLRAESLAKRVQGVAIDLVEIEHYLPKVDLVVTATSSKTPILTKEMITKALSFRTQPLLHLIDVSVPRNVAIEVGYLDNIKLYCIDDLEELGQHYSTKDKIINEALPIIEEVNTQFMRTTQIKPFSNTICALRQKFAVVRDQVLQDALQQLQAGKNPQLVLERMAHLLTNRLMHDPTIQLRQAGYSEDEHLFTTVHRLFNLTH